MKNKALCKQAEELLLRILPFVLVCALYTLFYIIMSDAYILSVTRSYVYQMLEHVWLSLLLIVGGALFTDICLKDFAKK